MRDKSGESNNLEGSLTLSEIQDQELAAEGGEKNLRSQAKYLVARITIMLIKCKPKQANRKVAGDQLGDVYEIIVKKTLKLERAKWELENLNLHLKEC